MSDPLKKKKLKSILFTPQVVQKNVSPSNTVCGRAVLLFFLSL